MDSPVPHSRLAHLEHAWNDGYAAHESQVVVCPYHEYNERQAWNAGYQQAGDDVMEQALSVKDKN
jgi:ribosome modulation factor